MVNRSFVINDDKDRRNRDLNRDKRPGRGRGGKKAADSKP